MLNQYCAETLSSTRRNIMAMTNSEVHHFGRCRLLGTHVLMTQNVVSEEALLSRRHRFNGNDVPHKEKYKKWRISIRADSTLLRLKRSHVAKMQSQTSAQRELLPMKALNYPAHKNASSKHTKPYQHKRITSPHKFIPSIWYTPFPD